MKTRLYSILLGVSIALCVVFALTTAFYYTKVSEYERYVSNSAKRSFSQLCGSITNIDTGLQKIRWAGNGPMLSTLAAQIWRESETAKFALSALPLSDAKLEKYEKFITQAGDFSFSLLRQNSMGAEIPTEHFTALQSLGTVARQLSGQLSTLQERLDASDLSLDDATLSARLLPQSEQPAPGASAELGSTEEEFPDYAKLIYDGPFSEHISSMTPKMLEDKNDVDEGDAMKAALKFLPSGDSLTSSGESAGIIPSYSFETRDITIQVSKKGGVVISMIDNRRLEEATLDAEAAIKKAAEYLKSHGYESMKESYYTLYENIVTINFA